MRREFEFLASLVYFIEAKTVVEVGVQFGNMAVYIAKAVQRNGGKYIGFDIWDIHGQVRQFWQMSNKEEVQNRLINEGLNNFELIQIDTINNQKLFEQKLKNHCPNGIDFAFIDGDHSYKGIANDFFTVYPLLNPKGVIAFHDTASIDGCREFMLDLRTKYYDGTFDLIDFPFGVEERHGGVSILSKRSYHMPDIKIDEVCGSISEPKLIEQKELEWYNTIITSVEPETYNFDITQKINHIGYYPERKKYE